MGKWVVCGTGTLTSAVSVLVFKMSRWSPIKILGMKGCILNACSSHFISVEYRTKVVEHIYSTDHLLNCWICNLKPALPNAVTSSETVFQDANSGAGGPVSPVWPLSLWSPIDMKFKTYKLQIKVELSSLKTLT